MYEFLGEETTIDNLDEFQKNKVEWLQDNNRYSDATKRTYWVIINTNFHDDEKKLNKDLYDFTKDEITKSMNSIIYTSMKSNTSLISILSNYINWAIKNGYKIGENPCENIDNYNGIKDLTTQIEIKYKTLNEFFEIIRNLKCSDVDKMLLVLARYGVAGEKLSDICNLKWTDIDKENMVIDVENNIKLPIDDRFIEYLNSAYRCETYEYQTSTLKYIDYGYIMKVSDKSENHTVNFNTLYTRANSIFSNNDMARIAFGHLVTWRRFDLLFEILKEKGEVTYDDVKNVLTISNGNSTMAKAQYLKERFMILKDYSEHLTNKT